MDPEEKNQHDLSAFAKGGAVTRTPLRQEGEEDDNSEANMEQNMDTETIPLIQLTQDDNERVLILKKSKKDLDRPLKNHLN